MSPLITGKFRITSKASRKSLRPGAALAASSEDNWARAVSRLARGARGSTPLGLGPNRSGKTASCAPAIVRGFVDLRFTAVRKSNLADPTTDEMVKWVCRFLVSSESCSCHAAARMARRAIA